MSARLATGPPGPVTETVGRVEGPFPTASAASDVAPVAPTAITLANTAVAEAGTRPVVATVIDFPAPRVSPVVRVSTSRLGAGSVSTRPLPVSTVSSITQPVMSTSTWALADDPTRMVPS